ncbi:MAG: GuaB3 family IMP dehydrogenase-related protein [Dehalococcoidia bacterium]|nr:GuaB3 family IMP dehydrogenase-related protein [Dehalococcoidia bacterium]
MSIPQFKEVRHAYGFEDVAIVPGDVTINPDQTDINLEIGHLRFTIPVLASAMDAVVSPSFAVRISQLGGLGVLNLEGVYSRYDDPQEAIDRISQSPPEFATGLLQKIYSAPIREELIGKWVHDIKAAGATCAVSVTPQNAKRIAPIAVEAGADIMVVQSTVTTARHISKSYRGLIFSELVEQINVPVIVGNCVTYNAALELMEAGVDGILVGVGPGAACTTREVTGVGVPQVSATLECAAAREEHLRRTGKYVAVLTDGGIRTGGDLCKAIVAGADGVMLGTPFAQTQEAPGKGFNWGMATPHPALPRGTRINAGIKGTLEQLLFGPTSRTDGTQNLISALRVCMGMCGAFTIRDMHRAEMVIAPSIQSEGKVFQMAGKL